MSGARDDNKDHSAEGPQGPTADLPGPRLEAGSQVGHFRIEHEIGRGGAGVVYLARDTKLDRHVAIKSLPLELRRDVRMRSRLKREAKLLASLDHPNIATIHDIVEQEESGGYLILEYIEGDTLAERISHRALDLREALSIAQQIAEAVAAAHEHGVTHRDLKPGNIKITPEDKVKVLDFGLAKAVGADATDRQSTVTEPGRVIGTPAYMSPEQARGKPTDKRCDIWSFGCVLYEMLAGKVPFEGETVSDTLANVLQKEPDWPALPQGVSANIQVLLRRCLEKDPHRRLRDIGDALIEIDDTLSLPATTSIISAPLTGTPWSAPWRWGIVCSFVGLTVGLIAASMFFLSRPTAPSLSPLAPVPVRRTAITLPENQVLGFFRSSPLGVRRPAFALSPDGSRLVYVADLTDRTQLFLRMMNEFQVSPIRGTDGASSPFFSPDGESVGYFADDKLKIVSLRGGEPMTVCDAGYPQTGSWGDDGMIYFIGGGGLSRVPVAGGDIDLLDTGSDLFTELYPQVLPGGRAVLISSRDGALLVSLETMEKKLLVKDVLYARYVRTGHLVYARAGAIEARPFNLATHEITGPPVPVINKILTDSVYGAAQFAFSNNGLLVYVPGDDTAKSIPVWVDRQGNVEPLDMPAQDYGTPSLSPDGRKLAIIVNELQSNVHIYDIATGLGTKLTLEGNNTSPVWTPDGKRVTFSCRREGEEDCYLFWQPADGSGKTELLHSSQHTLAPSSWSSDGTLLAFAEWHPTTMSDIWVLSLEENREPKLKLRTESTEHFSAFSPDCRWMAYTSGREGRSQVYVRPYPAMDRPIPISYGLGEESIWSPNGDELFYRSNHKWMVVPISTEPEFKAGTPHEIFEGAYLNVSGVSYDVAPDGQRFLVLQPQYDDSEVRELYVVHNWFEELKRLAPVRAEP
jgi:serine/threonine-protein kinase